MKTVTDLCADLGIELRGEDGHPYHCGEKMETRGGIVGIDQARCLCCGLEIANAASPHINGHGLPPGEVIEGGETWFRSDKVE